MTHEINYRKMAGLLCIYAAIGVFVGCVAILYQQLMSFFNIFILEGIGGYGETRIVWGDRRLNLPWTRPAAVRWWLLPALAGIGGLISGIIVKRFAPEAGGHGTDAVINAYHKGEGRLRPRASIVMMIASAITIGTGGSGGKEGPITQIGGGAASWIVDRLPRLAAYRREIMLAGMAAGIAAIFRAPLAAAIFATEILYSDLRFEGRILIPASIASATSYAIYSLYFGFDPIFVVPAFIYNLAPLDFVVYSVLGLVCAVGAIGFIKIFYGMHHRFQKWDIPVILKPAIGGVATGLIAIAIPQVLGEGSYAMKDMISGKFPYGLLALFFVGKIIATSFSIGSGGSGGIFGPSLFIGAALGGAFGGLYNWIFPETHIPVVVFMLLGMVGFFSAAANAPVATVIIVAEITRTFTLLAPFIWISIFGYLFSQRWNIYQSQISDVADVMTPPLDENIGREACATSYDGL
jgi:chloride channel protein, CIC family